MYACNWVEDWDDAERYTRQAKEGYEEQLGPDDAKTIDTTCGLILISCSIQAEMIKKLRDLVKWVERALGKQNIVTLKTLVKNRLVEDAKEVMER